MATHSSVLAWRIPGMGKPGGLPSMGVAQSRTRLKRLSSSSSRSGLFLLEYVFSKTPLLRGDRYIYKTLSHLPYLGNTGQPLGEPT